MRATGAGVHYVAVATEYRSQGLGKKPMRHAEAWLAKAGAPKVMLMIREENEAVRRFYERLGYDVEKRTIALNFVPAAGLRRSKCREHFDLTGLCTK